MLGPIRWRAGGGKKGGMESVGLSLSGMGRVGWVSGFCHSFFFSSPFYASETGCEGGKPRICVKEGE